MKEDIYSIACQCQTIIETQIKVTRNKILYPSLNLIFADYDINRGFLSESYSFRA